MTDWDELLRREGPAVWRAAFRLVRNRADAEECFQETFLDALEISNRQPVSNWPALLHRLATSRAFDRIRKRLRHARHEAAGDVSLAAGGELEPSQNAEAAELAGALRWAIAQLPERQAEVFCLHQLGDWSYQQIADELGMSAGAVGVMLHRTREKLQELLRMHSRLAAELARRRR